MKKSINYNNSFRHSCTYICDAVSTPLVGHYSWLFNACAGGLSFLYFTFNNNHSCN